MKLAQYLWFACNLHKSLYADFIVFCFSANMTTLRSTAIPYGPAMTSVRSPEIESRKVYRPCAAGPSPCTS